MSEVEGIVRWIGGIGMISLEMASKAPQRLQSLMLINTHAGGFGAFPPIQGNISELFLKICFTVVFLYMFTSVRE